MTRANESRHITGTTCHLSPIIRHESSQTFEGSQHRKTTPSWKDTQKACQEGFLFFLISEWVCVCVCLDECVHTCLTYQLVCVMATCVHPLLKCVKKAGFSVCCVSASGCLCMCVPVQMPPPYYSWLLDGCWLSHLPDFVPARCDGVTGKAPKHSSISTIVQHSFGSGSSFQYPFSRSRCWQKCLHTQKRGGQTYWPARSARVD